MELGLIRKIDIDHEMQQAYLDYAMSVIVARALPDARDGLKPVQRRILCAMYDMGIRAESPYKKSARIVGEVLGKYHPHGDSAVYEAMARMAQDFCMRTMLVDGQGNFGSLDGDPPAAMRYYRSERVRFFKFATVGAIGSVIDIGVMNLLTHFLGMRLVYAGSISFICAVISNVTLNRYWTYPDSRSRPLMHQLGMFFLVNSIGIGIRIPTLHYAEPLMAQVFENIVHLSHPAAESLAKTATLILAIGIVMIWNFFINRYWTYNDID